MHWTQRAGSIVTILGAYVAYVDAKRSVRYVGEALFMDLSLPYAAISVVLVGVGTVVWGYADLWL